MYAISSTSIDQFDSLTHVIVDLIVLTSTKFEDSGDKEKFMHLINTNIMEKIIQGFSQVQGLDGAYKEYNEVSEYFKEKLKQFQDEYNSIEEDSGSYEEHLDQIYSTHFSCISQDLQEVVGYLIHLIGKEASIGIDI